MPLLVIDTCSPHSAACVFDCDTRSVLAQDIQKIDRGHAEILMGQIENCMTMAGISYSDVQRIGVSTGPGSFTGIRVGMAAAKGFGLGLQVPVVGVSCLDACEWLAYQSKIGDTVLSVLNASRGQVFCKISGKFDCWIDTPDTLVKQLAQLKPSRLAGSAANRIAGLCDTSIEIAHEAAIFPVSAYAIIAAQITDTKTMPEPLYLRAADAKSQKDFALTRQ